jgi:heme/copper-type cytochrome/quinol oxidase subunit 1
MLGAFGFSIATPRLRRAAAWQPLVYGIGQMVFAAGFGLAGAYGMSRKAYGAEQAVRSTAETAGLAIMGVGGFVAIAGGLLFLGVVFAIWRRGTTTTPAEGEWRYRWDPKIRNASIRSRS